MKLNIVFCVLGSLLKLLALLILLPGLVAAIYREPLGVMAFALTALITLTLGIVLHRSGSKDDVTNREAFAIVSLGWLFTVFFGALPFVFMGIDPISALFESMSGFSATGATILTEKNIEGYYILNSTLVERSIASGLIEVVNNTLKSSVGNNITLFSTVPGPSTYYGLLFWRAFSQLIGGLGIILLFLALFPRLRVAGRHLYKAEAVGPTKDTIAPRTVESARILWKVYMLFVAVEILLLAAAKMPVYDAVCTAFATLATGGFSPKADSLAFYNSPLIDAIVAVFIFLGASNFSLHYLALKGDIKGWVKDTELRFFVLILTTATASLVLFGGIEGDLADRFRFASFQVVSFMGTCGAVNTLSYDSWSTSAKLTLIMVMLIGGCIGSTAGGIKVGRLLICLRYAYSELRHMMHPKAMIPVKFGEKIVQEEVLRSILFYSFFYLAAFFALSLLLAFTESGNPKVDLLVVTSGVASCMGGVGPAFGIITFDWSQISPLGKMIGFFAMYIGRLEIFPIIVLFLPELWKK